MQHKALESVTLADIERLQADSVNEGKGIEYKSAMYQLELAAPPDRKKQVEEMLKDISSFANTDGGDLLIGVEEDAGVPTGIPGISISDVDRLKLQISELVQNGLEPRINGMAIHAVPVTAGRYVLIIRVLRSLNAPHRVVHQRVFGQFWARNSAGAYMMDTSELRRSFTLSSSAYGRIKHFRLDRIQAVVNDDTPIALEPGPKLICHILPISSFSTDTQLVPSEFVPKPTEVSFLGDIASITSRFNFDGIVSHEALGNDPKPRFYVQFFRNGVIESVASSDVVYRYPDDSTAPSVFAHPLLGSICRAVVQYLKMLAAVGVTPPIWVAMTLVGVKGVVTFRQNNAYSKAIDRDRLFLPEIEFNDLSPANIHQDLRPAFDVLWNSAGCDRCPWYDENGRLKNAVAG